ncbi:hypothetical protein [Cytobacillus purgationiresistens]|uniref:Uncharacterized protein n=1 Tax=Cytobacillus purgationiresistens TaxID=863449 RepID=A0ABU0AIY0_9BACI|nr:hypothetical protein [Cytobacillus purgationiresistens]MDQ0271224.1 hypothetical protein [Cytobacillus purgationiresistens]
MFKVTFFLKMDIEELINHLSPKGIILNIKNQLTWKNDDEEFIIEPMSVRGREAQGYRAYFTSNPESGQYLIDHFLGIFPLSISGIEYKMTSSHSQKNLIKIAEDYGLYHGSLYGLFERRKVRVGILPSSEINVQLRNKKFHLSNLANDLREIETVAYGFKRHDFTPFSFSKYPQEELLLS